MKSSTFSYVEIEKLDKGLECSICLDILVNPRVEANCAQMFCQGCINKVKKVKPICPLCSNKIVEVVASKYIHNKLDEIKVVCNNCNDGKLMNRGDFKSHLSSDNCKTQVCNQCNGRFSKSEYPQPHLNHQCKFTIIKCSGNKVNCPFESTREQVLIHQTTCSYLSLESVLSNYIKSDIEKNLKIESLQNQNKLLIQENSTLKEEKEKLLKNIVSQNQVVQQVSNNLKAGYVTPLAFEDFQKRISQSLDNLIVETYDKFSKECLNQSIFETQITIELMIERILDKGKLHYALYFNLWNQFLECDINNKKKQRLEILNKLNKSYDYYESMKDNEKSQFDETNGTKCYFSSFILDITLKEFEKIIIPSKPDEKKRYLNLLGLMGEFYKRNWCSNLDGQSFIIKIIDSLLITEIKLDYLAFFFCDIRRNIALNITKQPSLYHYIESVFSRLQDIINKEELSFQIRSKIQIMLNKRNEWGICF